MLDKLNKLKRYAAQLGQIPHLRKELLATQVELAYVREALGRIELRQTSASPKNRLSDYEFRVYSQWGEDGIIQHLIRNLPIQNKSFIEFGVQSYIEANTRFLLIHDNWRGLIIDGGEENIAAVKTEELYWRYNLTAVTAFVTPENINDLLLANGFAGEIGLLSIDIDGIDYWVWKNVTVVNPAIVVAEYNSRFGPDRAVTVPLDNNFVRSQAHYSGVYYGASLAALTKLAHAKGYSLVGSNTNGNNAFFVRNDVMPADWITATPREAFVHCQFREARLADGRLAIIKPEEEIKLIEALPLTEV